MSSVPFSNPAGNNQTNPVSSLLPKGTAAMPVPKIGAGGGIPNAGTSTPGVFNPPGGARPLPMSSGGAAPIATGSAPVNVPNVGGLDPSTANKYGTTGALDKQLKDIYGKGIGGALGKLLEGMSGADSQILKDYIASLQPQMATAQADVNAALGRGGVSANSSVTAIADASLHANETAAIAGESARLTMSQEQLTAQLLSGMEGDAEKEVATSGWSIFGDVMNQITGDVGNLFGGDFKTKGNSPQARTPGPNMMQPQLDFGGAPPSGVDSGTDISGTTLESLDLGMFG